MAAKKNAFYSQSFLIFLTRFFPSLANLVVMILYSRSLSKADYGSYSNFWIQLSVFYSLICFGLHAFVVTYSPAALVSLVKKLKPGRITGYIVYGLGLSAVFALIETRSVELPFIVSFLFVAIYALTFILESVLMVFRSFVTLVVTSILYTVAFVTIHFYVLTDSFSVQKIFSLLLMAALIRAAIYAFSVHSMFSKAIDISEHEEVMNEKARSLFFHLGLYDVVQNLSLWIDKFVISIFCTTALSATYLNGSQNIPFIPLLITAVGSAMLLQLSGPEAGDEKEQTIALMNRSGRVLSAIVFPIFFFLLVYGNELFAVVFHNKYAGSVPIFIASVLILPVRAYNFTTVLQRLHRGDIINKGAIGELLLAIALMYPLNLWLGLPGLALSFVISTYVQAAYYIVSTSRLLQTSVFKLLPVVNWLIKFALTGTIIFGLHYIAGKNLSTKAALLAGMGTTAVALIAFLFIEARRQRQL